MTPTESYKELTPGWKITIQILSFMLVTTAGAAGWMFTAMLDTRERLAVIEQKTHKIPPDWFERHVDGLSAAIQDHEKRIRNLEFKNSR